MFLILKKDPFIMHTMVIHQQEYLGPILTLMTYTNQSIYFNT